MSKKKQKDRPVEAGLIEIYWRFLKEFARPYWFKIFIGAFAGFIIGGAMGAALRIMDLGLNTFEMGIKAEPAAIVQVESRTDTKELESPLDVVKEGELLPEEVSLNNDSAQLTQDTTEKKAKDQILLEKINKWFDRVGIDEFIDAQQALNLDTVFWLLAILFGFFILQSLGEFLNRYFLRWVGARVVTDIRIALFDKLQQQSLSFFDRTDAGALISRCTNDTNAIERVISNSIPELFTAPVFIIVAAQFIVSKTREVQLGTNALLMLLALPLCILPVYFISNYLKKFEKRSLERISTVTSRMLESFSGIRVIKSFNREKYEYSRFKSVNEHYFRNLRKAIFADVLVQPSMQLTAIALAAVFVLICYHHEVSFATLAVIGFAAQQAYKPIKDLAKINASLQKSAAAAERIFQIIDTDCTLPISENPVLLKDFKNEIFFDSVSFSYNPTDKAVLSDINLHIPKGHLVAVVGQTGSGKSTMANLLARFYDPSKGKILIDGHDLRDLDIEHFRNLVGIVSQDTFLFNDTIAENIAYGKLDASEEEIIEAAKQAKACEFINADPAGFERRVGERGNLLSGGQKQRLAIARAIIKNPPILILDEATSALDTVTEHLVQEALNNVMKDRTVLAIAHRLSTVQKADLILVIDEGRIIEKGNHNELLKHNGAYRKLYDMQFSQVAETKDIVEKELK